MFNIPDNASPEFQAFVTGMFLPFLAACLGAAVAFVKSILFTIKDNN